MKILAYRTTMPFKNRGYGDQAVLSPPTNKSVIPANNVPTIEDILSGEVSIKDVYPGTRGNWAPGKDVSTSYKDTGDDYKRKERDLDILNNMLQPKEPNVEAWKVKVDGGSMKFPSFPQAERYMRENKIPYKYLARVAQVQKNDIVEVVSDTLAKTFMVESLDLARGVKENGSAFCVYPKYFLTCAHVIKSYNKNKAQNLYDFHNNITVNLIHSGKRYRAELKALNTRLDLALLKADIDVEPFKLDLSQDIGEDILTIGSPHGYENNVSTGSLGSLNRDIYTYEGAPRYMFVDLSVFPGNSGGPVVKEINGSVIGMITLIISTSGGYGLNAALPSDYLIKFCQDNIAGF